MGGPTTKNGPFLLFGSFYPGPESQGSLLAAALAPGPLGCSGVRSASPPWWRNSSQCAVIACWLLWGHARTEVPWKHGPCLYCSTALLPVPGPIPGSHTLRSVVVQGMGKPDCSSVNPNSATYQLYKFILPPTSCITSGGQVNLFCASGPQLYKEDDNSTLLSLA